MGRQEGSIGIAYEDDILCDIALSADEEFILRDDHLAALKLALPGVTWKSKDSREPIFSLFRDSTPQMVYFYCHGVYTKKYNDPYLGVGVPGVDDAITTINVRDKGFRWEKTRPLVFINGCHTTALSPEEALNFVSAFVEATYASGVIGTEVAVFEPLATWFAEEFFTRFVTMRSQLAGPSAGLG